MNTTKKTLQERTIENIQREQDIFKCISKHLGNDVGGVVLEYVLLLEMYIKKRKRITRKMHNLLRIEFNYPRDFTSFTPLLPSHYPPNTRSVTRVYRAYQIFYIKRDKMRYILRKRINDLMVFCHTCSMCYKLKCLFEHMLLMILHSNVDIYHFTYTIQNSDSFVYLENPGHTVQGLKTLRKGTPYMWRDEVLNDKYNDAQRCVQGGIYHWGHFDFQYSIFDDVFEDSLITINQIPCKIELERI